MAQLGKGTEPKRPVRMCCHPQSHSKLGFVRTKSGTTQPNTLRDGLGRSYECAENGTSSCRGTTHRSCSRWLCLHADAEADSTSPRSGSSEKFRSRHRRFFETAVKLIRQPAAGPNLLCQH